MSAFPAGVYIHIPFCRRKCDYCSFYSIDDTALVAPTVEAIAAEIASFEYPGIPVDTVYFGGGTPLAVGADTLRALLDTIRHRFAVSDDAEITVEINPAYATRAELDALHAAGVNRITLGVQTLDPAVGQFLGRVLASREHLEALVDHTGFNVCVDFICGVPGQTAESIAEELAVLAGMARHVSVYLLSVDEGTPLAARYGEHGDAGFEEFQASCYRAVYVALAEHGLEHYEISNFSLPGYASRHNMKYWTFGSYAGFGPGAHSFMAGRRYANAADAAAYARHGAVRQYDERSAEQSAAEFLMTGLRLKEGIDRAALRALAAPAVIARIDEAIARGVERDELWADASRAGIIWEPGRLLLSDSIIAAVAGAAIRTR